MYHHFLMVILKTWKNKYTTLRIIDERNNIICSYSGEVIINKGGLLFSDKLPKKMEIIDSKYKNYYNYFIMYSGKYVFAAENGEYIKISSIKARAINREVLKLKSKNLEFLIDIKNFNLEEYCLELNN